MHYEGERRKEAMLKFAEKCAGPVVDRIGSREKMNEAFAFIILVLNSCHNF